MRIADLDYHLPPHAIATRPAEPRDASRLMVVQPCGVAVPPMSSAVAHRRFRDLPDYLRPGDLLVVNQTRVLSAKLALRKNSGAAISGLFLRELAPGTWEVMLRTRGKAKPGDILLAPPYHFELATRLGEGLWQVRVTPVQNAAAILEQIGHVPLPPYITRQRKATGDAEEVPADRAAYQTVYAGHAAGSVAAPTAGLHFTPELLTRLDNMGVQRATVDLHVGPGTFLPVETETLAEHPMHAERYFVPAATVSALRQARAEQRRIIAVGTTAVRTLESVAAQILDTTVPADLTGETRLLISPGHTFRLTDALITNFHLPKSTLMALVAAFLGPSGVERLKQLYGTAIEQGYRFYSYGDAMLLLP